MFKCYFTEAPSKWGPSFLICNVMSKIQDINDIVRFLCRIMVPATFVLRSNNRLENTPVHESND